ncbi:MAG: PilZ domain-containing protein [Deltaproteobacteria bacterium]|jgi:c-di-GMP-binding flagellar brake protein YcgR|nr:PilZ domain-containing protein [Deltaproteobacteria bacterium]
MTNNSNGSENRQSVRLPKAYTVEVKELAFPATGAGIESSVNDISQGGISIESPRPLDAGQTMQVKVHIPMLNRFSSSFFKVYENDADQYFMAIAKVIWCKPAAGKYMVGMEFVNVDDTQSRALAALIDKAMRETS